MSYNLDTGIQSSTCYLDSTNCSSRDEYYTYQLNTGIKCPTGCRMLLSVTSVSLPNVINNITEYNNKFSLQTNHSPTLTDFTITFPVGIYSAWSWRDYINSQFVSRGIPVTCIYSNNSFKYTFVSSYDFNIKNTTNYPTTCGHLIGVGKGDDNQFIFPLLAGVPYFSVAMPSTVNFSPTPYVFLKVNDFSLTNINSLGTINNTLLRFPVNCQYGEMIQYRPAELNRFLINRSSIISMDISLEDIYNRPLSLPNAVELQVILKFDYVFPMKEKAAYNAGTIFHFLKENPITETDDDGEVEELGN